MAIVFFYFKLQNYDVGCWTKVRMLIAGKEPKNLEILEKFREAGKGMLLK